MHIIKSVFPRIHTLLCGALIAAAGLTCASAASAAPVTFEFAGTLTQASADPDNPFNGDVGFGTAFSGIYVFDSTTPDAIPEAGSGSYSSPGGSTFGLAVIIGAGNQFETGDFFNIGVINGAIDFYTVLACQGGISCPNLVIELFLEDLAGLMVSSDALPLDTPALGSAFGRFGLRAILAGNQVELLGDITRLACVSGCAVTPDPDPGPNPAPIAEPATLVLCMTGLAGGIWTRARKRMIS
jgi:hypothetical protein